MITLSHTIETFLKATLPDVYQSDTGLERFNWTYILLSVIRIFILYYMARFLAGLFQKPLPKRALSATLMIIAGFLVLQMVSFMRFGQDLEIPRYLAMFVHFAFFAILCLMLVRGFGFAREARNRSRKRALISFMSFLLLFNCLLFINRIGGYTSWISLNTQMLIISILMLGYNFYHVFFFDHFLRDYLIEYPAPGMTRFNFLVQKFQITKRKKDIIHLICEGKTNKEIASDLFISPVTVRDHLSRIFEKTNSKSRLQLASLFLSQGYYFINVRNFDLRKALGYYQEAIRSDSLNSKAHLRISYATNLLYSDIENRRDTLIEESGRAIDRTALTTFRRKC